MRGAADAQAAEKGTDTKMNSYPGTTVSSSYNIAHNSLERRFEVRGAVEAARLCAAEQEARERDTAALAPEAYKLGERKGCRDWDHKYKTGRHDGEFYMTPEDYKRCFADGMGYRPEIIAARCAGGPKREWKAERPAALYEPAASEASLITVDGRKLTPAQVRDEARLNRVMPKEKIVPIKGHGARALPIGAMALVLIFAVVLALPIALSVSIKERSDELAAAEAKLAELDAEIAELENELNVKNDLELIRRIAVDEYGMISANVSTTRYLSLGLGDRIEAFDTDEGNAGMTALLSALGIRIGK